ADTGGTWPAARRAGLYHLALWLEPTAHARGTALPLGPGHGGDAVRPPSLRRDDFGPWIRAHAGHFRAHTVEPGELDGVLRHSAGDVRVGDRSGAVLERTDAATADHARGLGAVRLRVDRAWPGTND